MTSTADFDHLLAAVLLGLASLYVIRTAAGCLLWALSTVPGRLGDACRRAATRVTPALARRLLAAALGAAAVGTTAGFGTQVASAVSIDRGSTRVSRDAEIVNQPWRHNTERTATALGLDRAELPTSRRQLRPLTAQPSKFMTTVPNRPPSRATEETITIRQGDCLWRIAQRRLSRAASASEIDREWRRWYRANRSAIGPDPDLLAVGLKLQAPA